MKTSALKFLLIATLATSLSAQTVTLFDTSFTASDGWFDGGINFGGDNPDSLIGQGGMSLSDTATTGILNGASSFNRALFGWNSGFSEAEVLALDIGSTISVAATGVTISAGGNNNFVLGLSNVDDGNILGNSSMADGGHLTSDGTNIFAQNSNFSVDTAGRIDTGVDVGETFNYEVRFTATAAEIFTVEQIINGNLIFSETGQSFNFSNSGTQAVGHFQDFGGGAATIDALSFSYTAVPEPNQFALLFGVLGIGFAVTRRRL
ncbi:MAG: PEP-CTERM sorting domain-containing protein [Verrucomicrobiota bacterium]